MPTPLQAAVAAYIAAHGDTDGVHLTQIDRLVLMRSRRESLPHHVLYRPTLCVVVQGAKQVMLGDGVFHYGEMQALVSSFWAAAFFEDAGRAKAGAGVFAAKKCGACHQSASSGALQLPSAGRKFSGADMLSALWKHGPNMLVEFALVTLRCTICKGAGARAVMLRLCDPDCPRQRR